MKKALLGSFATSAVVCTVGAVALVSSYYSDFTTKVQFNVGRKILQSNLAVDFNSRYAARFKTVDAKPIIVIAPKHRALNARLHQLNVQDQKLDAEIQALEEKISAVQKLATVVTASIEEAPQSELSLYDRLNEQFLVSVGAVLEYPVIEEVDVSVDEIDPELVHDKKALLSFIQENLNTQKKKSLSLNIQKKEQKKLDIQKMEQTRKIADQSPVLDKAEIPEPTPSYKPNSGSSGSFLEKLAGIKIPEFIQLVATADAAQVPIKAAAIEPENTIQKPTKTESKPTLNTQSNAKAVRTTNASGLNKTKLLNTQTKNEYPKVEYSDEYPLQDKQTEYSEKSSTSVNVNMQKTETYAFTGYIVEALTNGTKPIAGAKVQIIGSQVETYTNESGAFNFGKLSVEGVLPVVIQKQGYMNRRLELRPAQRSTYEIISENYAAMASLAADDKKQAGFGFVFGQISGDSGNYKRYKVEAISTEGGQLTRLKPVYLDEKGKPNPALDSASSRGQFIFTSVRPSSYLLNVVDASGVEKAPHLFHVSEEEGIVRKFDVGVSTYIRGRVLNAAYLNAAVNSAQVQMLGSSTTVQTDAKGRFLLGPVYIDCSEKNYLQVEKTGFYRNRMEYSCENRGAEFPLYVYSGSHVDSVALDAQLQLKPTKAIVIGHVSFKESSKVQLWGPSEVLMSQDSTRGKDFYFDQDGVLNPDLNRTTKNGNFSVLESPEGLSYLQTFDENNNTRSYWPVYLSPSTVSVHIQ